jgi:hypothetical protein
MWNMQDIEKSLALGCNRLCAFAVFIWCRSTAAPLSYANKSEMHNNFIKQEIIARLHQKFDTDERPLRCIQSPIYMLLARVYFKPGCSVTLFAPGCILQYSSYKNTMFCPWTHAKVENVQIIIDRPAHKTKLTYTTSNLRQFSATLRRCHCPLAETSTVTSR